MDGPILAPDLLQGYNFGTCPHDYLAAEYKRRLASSSSARKDGRHYVAGYLHYQLPDSCWIIDPMETHFVDVMVDIDAVGGTRNSQSVVMIRNVTKIDTDTDHVALLGRVTSNNTGLRKVESKGYARNKCEDVGTMHAIGTRIPLNGVGMPAPYAANGKFPEGALRELVVDLATLGSCCFPQVYSVVRDMEGDSGILPVEPMDGAALTVDECEKMVPDGGEHNVPAQSNVDADSTGPLVGADEAVDESSDVELDDDTSIETALENKERCRRVGYTIDMSIDLGNASHYDVHDASQGFSVWTEEVPGCGANWFFVLPNLHGTKPDGINRFHGMAVKLGHGVAISWDGRKIRHCTSVSHPDGMESGRVGGARDSYFHNHLYGTFTGAKERIVKAGRALSAAKYCALSSSAGNNSNAVHRVGKKKKKNKKSTRRKRNGRGRQVGGAIDAAEPNVVDHYMTESVVESPAVLLDHRVTTGDNIHPTTDWKTRADTGRFQPDNDERKRKGVPDQAVTCRLQARDLDVGGRYKIPKKIRGASGDK